MPMRLVKIFGERNTGTNVLDILIQRNSRSCVLPATEYHIDRAAATQAWNLPPMEREEAIDPVYDGVSELLAWKHCATDFADARAFKGALVLFTVRHPISWFVALFRRPYHLLGPHPSMLAEFLEFEWRTVRRERLGCAALHPIQLYNRKIASYLAFSERLAEAAVPHRFVRQEDLALSQFRTFKAIRPDLLKPRILFLPVVRSSKIGGKSLLAYRRYYAAQSWKVEIAGIEDVVNEQVDWKPLARFGYTPS
jgi:hypothetical protein